MSRSTFTNCVREYIYIYTCSMYGLKHIKNALTHMYTSILHMYVCKSKYVCININILIQYMVSLYSWSTLYLAYFNHSTKVPCVELLSGHKVLSLGGVLSRFSRANISSTLFCPKLRKKKSRAVYLANYERNPFKYSQQLVKVALVCVFQRCFETTI